MDAVAHNPAFAKKVGVPTKVGKEFSKADKKMKGGGLYENINANVKESLTALAKRCAEWAAKVRQRLMPSSSQQKPPK